MTQTNVVPQGLFGPGICWALRTDIANATPYNVGYCNEFSTDITFTVKDLYGQNQYALLSARGTAKSTGKLKAATMSGQTLSGILLGQTWTVGKQYDATTLKGSVSTASPYSYTPAIPASGVFDADLGVVYNASAEPLFYTASTAPAAGNYHVTSSGKYTFNAAQKGSTVNVSFGYGSSVGQSGQSMIIQNQPIGTTPTFQITYKTSLYGATYSVVFYQAICNKWQMGHKLEDFAMPEFDFSFFANAAGNIGRISLATQA